MCAAIVLTTLSAQRSGSGEIGSRFDDRRGMGMVSCFYSISGRGGGVGLRIAAVKLQRCKTGCGAYMLD